MGASQPLIRHPSLVDRLSFSHTSRKQDAIRFKNLKIDRPEDDYLSISIMIISQRLNTDNQMIKFFSIQIIIKQKASHREKLA